MHITMVKKRLENGEPCRKCVQAEGVLKNRGHYDRIDEVVWADEADANSAGMLLAQKHAIEVAPFFIVEKNGAERVYTSVIDFIKRELTPVQEPAATNGAGAPGARDAAPAGIAAPSTAPARAAAPSAAPARTGAAPEAPPGLDPKRVEEYAAELAAATPQEILRFAFEHFGKDCGISFSGAEDVVLLDMAVALGVPVKAFTLDTGRLHPETHRFLDRVRKHYGIELQVYTPSADRLEPFVRRKGLFSFYEDGHHECCEIRKVEPLSRAVSRLNAWITGQRRDQSVTRSSLAVLELDTRFSGKADTLFKFNPLANWSSAEVWRYLQDNDVPYNELHERGFVSIGCEPCTRAVRPGEHERAGRWWWELETKRECGLHVAEPKRAE